MIDNGCTDGGLYTTSSPSTCTFTCAAGYVPSSPVSSTCTVHGATDTLYNWEASYQPDPDITCTSAYDTKAKPQLVSANCYRSFLYVSCHADVDCPAHSVGTS
eukprot:SAG31_NODE_13305_length_878_cov_1.365854_2_plen_102_part_01